jgi:magnesium transporter
VARKGSRLDSAQDEKSERVISCPPPPFTRKPPCPEPITCIEESYGLRQRNQADALFETLGFHVTQVGNASPFWAFRLRVPWLLATIASGTLCALLASLYELTLAKSMVLAFFLTLVLGLGESVSMQSMSVTIQAMRSVRPNLS